MLYRILGRIFQRHVIFHLFIPLAIGIAVEVLYTRIFDPNEWKNLFQHLLSGPRIALYIGIFLAYLVVIGILIRHETRVFLRQTDLYALSKKLEAARSVFVVGTMRFPEWFDPAVQVYLATIFERKLKADPFQYDRVLLLGSHSAAKDLAVDYLDGYQAKCLIGTHRPLGIGLGFLERDQIEKILAAMTREEKMAIGYYPSRGYEWIQKIFVWAFTSHRIRRTAVGVMEMKDNTMVAFRFSKRAIVTVKLEPAKTQDGCFKFVELIKNEIYEANTTNIQPAYDFTHYY